jgi:hypothetical protein
MLIKANFQTKKYLKNSHRRIQSLTALIVEQENSIKQNCLTERNQNNIMISE